MKLNKGPLTKVQDLSQYSGKPKPKKILIEVKKKPTTPSFKQYGDKGYKPSTGKGVGM